MLYECMVDTRMLVLCCYHLTTAMRFISSSDRCLFYDADSVYIGGSFAYIGTIRYDIRYDTIRKDTIRYDTTRYDTDCRQNIHDNKWLNVTLCSCLQTITFLSIFVLLKYAHYVVLGNTTFCSPLWNILYNHSLGQWNST